VKRVNQLVSAHRESYNCVFAYGKSQVKFKVPLGIPRQQDV